MRARNAAALACAILSLAACAPVYKDFTHYDAPGDKAGMRCLAEAEADRGDCLRASREAYEYCREGRRIEAERAYDIARDDYEFEADDYRNCSREIERRHTRQHERRVEQARRDWRKAHDAYKRCVSRLKPGQPNKCSNPGGSPNEPGFDRKAMVKEIRRSCGFEPSSPALRDFEDYRACGSPEGRCKAEYDAAYRACGGTVTIETRCVANCD